jgi:hypothetical protein
MNEISEEKKYNIVNLVEKGILARQITRQLQVDEETKRYETKSTQQRKSPKVVVQPRYPKQRLIASREPSLQVRQIPQRRWRVSFAMARLQTYIQPPCDAHYEESA